MPLMPFLLQNLDSSDLVGQGEATWVFKKTKFLLQMERNSPRGLMFLTRVLSGEDYHAICDFSLLQKMKKSIWIVYGQGDVSQVVVWAREGPLKIIFIGTCLVCSTPLKKTHDHWDNLSIPPPKGGIQKLSWQEFGFFWPPTFLRLHFYTNIDKRLKLSSYLPTLRYTEMHRR